jgi:putative hydrolase of the HAD superfamily
VEHVSGSDIAGAVLTLDVDGVLLDPERGGAGHWQRELERRFGVDAEDLSEAFFRSVWPDIIVGRRLLEPELSLAIERLAWPMTARELIDCWFESDLHLNEHVFAAADRWAARGVRIALATNQEHERAAFLSRRFRSRLPIERVLYSAALGSQKPDPDFFRAASADLTHHGLVGQVVFVDDAAANVAAARSEGWAAVRYRDDPRWLDEVESLLSRP